MGAAAAADSRRQRSGGEGVLREVLRRAWLLPHVVRWGANDGPDDAFENTAGWPEPHALGASDEILHLHLKAWEGMLRQFTEAKTTDVPIGRQGMYHKDFSVQSDWMHHGEALRTFNVLALSATRVISRCGSHPARGRR